jgi:N-acetylglucosaminyldiphosphoundecaprenol N-acetyl-beta-D-mannosaminyltransferase
MDVPVHVVDQAQALDHIATELQTGRGGWVITVNLDLLRRAVRDTQFRQWVDQADLVVADGMPLVWASRLRGTPLPERVAGSTIVSTLSQRLARDGRGLFLLGGDPGAAEGAAQRLARDTPGLRIVGTHCPPLGFEDDPQQMQAVREAIRQAGPDVVYVALGSPKQERLIERLRRELGEEVAGTWWLGVGISLGFLSGQVRRAPKLVQKLGLEWAHRLMQEPKRLARRYLVDGIPFAVRLLGHSTAQRFSNRKAECEAG